MNKMWKTWGREVYSFTFRHWLASMIECHVVYRLRPPFTGNLPLLGLLLVFILSGCTARQRTTETFTRDKDGNVVKITRTVTETVKEEKDVPVTRHVATIRSRTQTTGGKEDLHQVQIKSDGKLPDPAVDAAGTAKSLN